MKKTTVDSKGVTATLINRIHRTGITMLGVTIISIILISCADPLTKTMRRYSYVAPMPVSSTLHIGSIYNTADMKDPYALMRDLFTVEENDEMMKKMKDDVVIPNFSSESSFKVSADADIVGKAKVELEAYSITKFKVIFGGLTQYLVSTTKFEDEIYPSIKRKLPGRNFDKKFAIVALLRVTSLEYEFLNDKNGKVEIKPGTDIEKVLQAKIGAEWSANQKGNLSIDSPKFIGYRMARLNANTFLNLKDIKATNIPLKDIKATNIPLKDLQNSAR